MTVEIKASVRRPRLWLALLLAAAASQMAMTAPPPGHGPSAQTPAAESPPACRTDAQGKVDNQACFDAAAPGSPEQALAAINLGTQAFLRQDYAAAVRFYDVAQPPAGTKKVYSDVSLHVFRAAAFEHVGRLEEALENARIALAMLNGVTLLGMPEGAQFNPKTEIPREIYYANILPILRRANDPGYAAALAAYRAIPSTDWVSVANRAAVLQQLDDLPGAVAAMTEALKLAPADQPVVLNSACYILALAGRPTEGLPYCEHALALAPDIAAIHDSYAAALERLNRCTEAQAQLAEARRLDPTSPDYRRTACAGK